MSRLTQDGTAEPVSRDQILRHERGQGNIHFSCSADHEQDWQPYPGDLITIHTYMFGILGSRCLTGSAMLDCHVLKGFGIYMIGIVSFND